MQHNEEKEGNEVEGAKSIEAAAPDPPDEGSQRTASVKRRKGKAKTAKPTEATLFEKLEQRIFMLETQLSDEGIEAMRSELAHTKEIYASLSQAAKFLEYTGILPSPPMPASSKSQASKWEKRIAVWNAWKYEFEKRGKVLAEAK